MFTLYGYMNCSTCRDAIKWLDEHGRAHKFIDITANPPAKAVLKKIASQDKPVAYQLKHLFNSSGMQYRQQGIAAKRKAMSGEAQFDMLAANGMLVKRPIATDGRVFTVGFDPEMYLRVWGNA